MKTILFCSALALLGCKKGSSASNCADAINKGVDTMMAAGAKRMENAPAEMKAKMDEAAVKLKGVITNRCTEDKWPAEVITCYASATKREDLRDCRAKLPQDQQAKLQSEEMQVMMGAGFGGMRPHGMGGPGGPGMGGPGMGGPGMGGPGMAGSGMAGSGRGTGRTGGLGRTGLGGTGGGLGSTGGEVAVVLGHDGRWPDVPHAGPRRLDPGLRLREKSQGGPAAARARQSGAARHGSHRLTLSAGSSDRA